MIKFCNILIVFTLFLFLSSCGEKKDPVEKVTISFTGDIIMHMPVRTSARLHNRTDPRTGKSLNCGGYAYLFERIAPHLRKKDIVLGNMEFPVAAPYRSVPWIFNCSPDVLDALEHAGFTAFTIANNHMMDQGERGITETLTHLSLRDMPVVGAGPDERTAREGMIIKKSGIKTAFLAYTGTLNFRKPEGGDACFINWFYDWKRLFEDIRRAKKKSDFLVLIIHTGNEYATHPAPLDETLMKMSIEAGADCIIGHHPHILQRAEEYTAWDGRRGHIFYSLGNFISNQSSPGTRESAVITINLVRKGEKTAAIYEALPIRTVNRKWGTRSIQVSAIKDELEYLNKRLPGADISKRAAIKRDMKILKNMELSIARQLGGSIQEGRVIHPFINFILWKGGEQ